MRGVLVFCIEQLVPLSNAAGILCESPELENNPGNNKEIWFQVTSERRSWGLKIFTQTVLNSIRCCFCTIADTQFRQDTTYIIPDCSLS